MEEAIEARQHHLNRRIAPFEIAATINFGEMYHDFEHQEIGPSHDVPSTAGTEAFHHFFQHANVQLHGFRRSHAGIGHKFGHSRHVVAQVS